MYWILVAWFTFVLWLSARAEHVRADRHTFTSVAVPDSGLTYVKNSGICETTPGVGQMSGYINVTENASIVCYPFGARWFKSLIPSSGSGSSKLAVRRKPHLSRCGTDEELLGWLKADRLSRLNGGPGEPRACLGFAQPQI